MTRASDPAPPAGSRRLLFTGLMLLIPVLFFGLLEGGLRLGGYGDDYPLFVPVEGHSQYLVQSRAVARRYFARQADVPTSLHDVFDAEKGPDEFRVFVQGGSTAAGFPFYHGGAFSRMLEYRLQQTFPERKVEVVNTAMAAVNSYTLRDLADEIIAQQPDAVLIYAGHNEYYGALGVGSTESLGRFRGLVNTYLALRRFRTVQLSRDALGGAAGLLAGGEAEAARGTLMERMVGEQVIPYGSAAYESGLRQFRSNLAALLGAYERAGVPVFVATLASNERDQRPFVTVFEETTDEAAWRARYLEALEALRAGDVTSARATLEVLVAEDTLAADGFYALGRAHEAAGDTASALRAYVAARDRDALRFRAPEVFNQVIREVAARHGAAVVDAQAAFRRAAPGGIIGKEHMLEHLHPTVDGYALLADAFYDALRDAALIGDWRNAVPADVARRTLTLTPADSLVGLLRIRKLMGGWPFRPRSAPPLALDTLTVRTEFERIVLALYRAEVTWLEATERLATYYEQAGDTARAVRAREAMVASYPMLTPPRLGLAGLYLRTGRLTEAERAFEAAAARDPRSPTPPAMLGAIALERGETARAIALLERARSLEPRNAQTLYNLSGAYALSGRYAEAREAAGAVLALQPDHARARALLGSLPPPGAQSSP